MESKNCRNFYWNAIVRIFWLCLIDPDAILYIIYCLISFAKWAFVFCFARLRMQQKDIPSQEWIHIGTWLFAFCFFGSQSLAFSSRFAFACLLDSSNAMLLICISCILIRHHQFVQIGQYLTFTIKNAEKSIDGWVHDHNKCALYSIIFAQWTHVIRSDKRQNR